MALPVHLSQRALHMASEFIAVLLKHRVHTCAVKRPDVVRCMVVDVNVSASTAAERFPAPGR
jgi:hypothetical protein